MTKDICEIASAKLKAGVTAVKMTTDSDDEGGGGSSGEDNFGKAFADGDMEPELVEEERQQWGHSLQFFFTILGFCVGLGNIWRFPYLCQANGGGAFIIPFLVMLVLEGMPLMLLELGIGQKLRKGSYIVWNLVHPRLGGIGLGSTVIAVIVGCYYNMIIAWCFYYLFNSFWPTLPWSECPTELVGNVTVPVEECAMSSETQFYWYRQALDISPTISDIGGIKWWMLLCLALSWVVVYLIIMRGIQSSGKIVYFTAMFPYVVLTIFLIRGLTLEGAGAGLAHMFKPRLEKLFSINVWLDAAVQVFYAYGLAFGSIIGFGSYNPPNKNCVRDVYLISACNAFTAVYACAVVFSILGFKAQHLFDKCMQHDLSVLQGPDFTHLNLAHLPTTGPEYEALMVSDPLKSLNSNLTSHLHNCTLEKELDEAAGGTGLAFIVMADVFTKLPWAPVWSLLFFAMLLSLGLGSQIGILEGILSTLFDMPQLSKYGKPLLSGVACFGCFLIGALFCTGAGEYWLTLFDKYGALGLTLIAFAEIMSVMYLYGHRRFTNDIHEMTGVRPGPYWQLMWRFVSPVLILVLLLFTIVSEFMQMPTYSTWDSITAKVLAKQPYPGWAMFIGGTLAISCLVPIVLIAVLRYFKIPFLELGAAGMRRIETTASTKPMLPQAQDYLPGEMIADNSSDTSSDSGEEKATRLVV